MLLGFCQRFGIFVLPFRIFFGPEARDERECERTSERGRASEGRASKRRVRKGRAGEWRAIERARREGEDEGGRGERASEGVSERARG